MHDIFDTKIKIPNNLLATCSREILTVSVADDDWSFPAFEVVL